MKKIVKLFLLIVALLIITITLVGCNNKNKLSNNINKSKSVISVDENTQITSNSALVKDGLYEMVLSENDIDLAEGQICLEITGNIITIGDGFSGAAEQGTFEIKDNKIVGDYTKVTYIDHSNGGKMTEESIQEEFCFDILEDGSLKDNYGYGSKFGHINYQGRIYKMVEEF